MPSRVARLPRLRFLLGLAIVGPPLAIGGVWPWTIPVLALVVAAALLLLRHRGAPLRRPTALGLGLLAAGATLVQVLPLPGLRAALAPGLHAWVEHATGGLQASGWPSLSPTPADTALELLRLLALSGLVLICAQRSWRVTAGLVAAAGTAVAIVGLVQHGLHVDRIYGLYEARHATTGREATLLATFVNPNHQSGLLLLGLFATSGLALAHRREEARLEPRLVLGIALLLQLAALVLSMSRAALLAGAVAGALAAGLAVASAPRHALGKGRWPARSLPWLATLVGVVAGLGMLGAWDELAALLDGDALDPATSLRLRMMAGSLPLLDLAPITGIGRGAFGDVFAAFDPEPSAVWISHLECAPLAMLVEWGLVGGVLLVALPAWWISAMRGAGRHDDATARRIVLLGLLALAMQGLADFSLEFLGVAAPACALAGALSPMRPGPSLVLPRTPIVGLLVLALPAPLLLPSSWAALSTRDDLDRAPATDAEVAARPLHASLHRRRARAALALGDWDTARTRAQAAVRLRPAVVDGWLLLAAAERGRGEPAAERRATTEALQCLHHRASPELVRYLVERHEPDELARVAPAGGPGWSFLVEGLLEHAPRHADALARARTAAEPLAPEPLRVLVEANLALERPALALHHARLWRQLEPTDVHAHLAVVRALEHHEPIRPAALREALQRALDEADLDEPALRGLVEEQLIRAMLRERAPGDEARLAELARALRTRPADDQTRRRRLALVDPLLRP